MKQIDLLSVNLDNLDDHITATPGCYYKWSCVLADLWLERETLKRLWQDAKDEADQEISRAEARKFLDLRAKKEEDKRWTDDVIKATLRSDPELTLKRQVCAARTLTAHENYLKVELKHKKLAAFLDSLDMKASFICGLQGRAREEMKNSKRDR